MLKFLVEKANDKLVEKYGYRDVLYFLTRLHTSSRDEITLGKQVFSFGM